MTNEEKSVLFKYLDDLPCSADFRTLTLNN